MLDKSFGLLFYLKKPKNYCKGVVPIYLRITVDKCDFLCRYIKVSYEFFFYSIINIESINFRCTNITKDDLCSSMFIFSCKVLTAKSMFRAIWLPSIFPIPATRSCLVVKVKFLNLCASSTNSGQRLTL